ncbi:MAG: phosphate/phosphite/phosphonate ABC transporter substrate-binding protein [Desulfobacteraceae bacterium]|jgi:phosphonate transport system substrate-binding protein|nr:phosphate/phosphite/phosphonate ABC transporter substrate-binding protein [Desulfobacteraceae bacterium]
MQPFFLSLLTLACLLTTACDPQEKPLTVDLSQREALRLAEDPEAVTYAYLPQYTHRASHQRHHLLVAYLERQTGLKFRQVFPDSFDRHLEMIGQGRIDITYSNPFFYITAARRYGNRAFAAALESYGGRLFRGQIICRADNPAIRTVADCRGKRWIAVAPSSSGGYLYPLGLFRDSGIEPADFAEIAFAPGVAGKQERVVMAVLAGKYDIGTVREGALEVLADRIDLSDLRVVAATPWYPGWVFSARSGLDPHLLETISTALLKLDLLNFEDRKILEAADLTGIVAARDGDFDSVRELARRLGLDQTP